MSHDVQKNERLIGGIPLDIKALIENPNQRFVVHGVSNKEPIEIESSDYTGNEIPHRASLNVQRSDTNYNFSGVWHAQNQGLQNVITIHAETEDIVTGKKDPDFYAGDLVDAFFNFLEGRGRDVENIRFLWRGPYTDAETHEHVPATRTFTEFMEAQKSMPAEQAAFTTWTGSRIALRHGFTEVKSIHIEEDKKSVSGVFSKP